MIPDDPSNSDDVAVSDPFLGPGEMRERYRSTDWSTTALGPVTQWSPVLRVMTEVCLDSGFPMVVSWGPDVVMLYNDAYVPLLGDGLHPRALGMPVREIWPDAWAITGQFVEEVMVRGGSVRRDDRQMILQRNGYPEECYFTFSHSPIRDPAGTVLGMFTVAAETTGHVLHQRRLGVAQQIGGLSATHLGSPEQTCQAAMDVLSQARESLPFAAVYLRKEANGPAHQVTRYGVADEAVVPGLTSAPDDNQVVVRQVLATGRSVVATGLRARFPDAFLPGPLGPLAPAEAVVVPLTIIGTEAPVGVLVLGVNPYRPLDEPYREFFALIGRQLSVALADSYAYQYELGRARALADLDQVKTEFFQNVSHELRTPLTLLLAPLQDLLGSTSVTLPAAERADLQAAVRSAERLQRMVDALLDFSRSATGTLVPAVQRLDLAALTADVAGMFRSTAEHAGIAFDVDVPTEGVVASVDPAMWSTIVNNLLSNAVKYTASGSISVRLRGFEPDELGVDSSGRTDRIELTVADTGIGIPAEEQPLVFERFHRSHSAPANGGAGIGLALVTDLVRAHRGEVQLTSAPGAGTRMTVLLPAARTSHSTSGFDTDTVRAGSAAARLVGHSDDGSERAASGLIGPADTALTTPLNVADAAAESVPAKHLSPGTRVLLVEDDDDLRAYLTRLLESDGWTVDAMADAESAVAAAFDPDRTSVPQVILSDVMLPGQSGLDLLITLRNAERTARVPIILLTARAGADAAIEGLSHGADDYVTKPFSSAELLARVRVHHELNQLRENAVGEAQTRVTQLRTALHSNRTIGTAVGLLISGLGLSQADSFQVLVRASQNTNRKLRDVAGDVVSAGRLPFPAAVIDELVREITGAVPRSTATDLPARR